MKPDCRMATKHLYERRPTIHGRKRKGDDAVAARKVSEDSSQSIVK